MNLKSQNPEFDTDFFSALNHTLRRQALLSLLERGPLCVCHLTERLGASQPTISRQMAIQKKASSDLSGKASGSITISPGSFPAGPGQYWTHCGRRGRTFRTSPCISHKIFVPDRTRPICSFCARKMPVVPRSPSDGRELLAEQGWKSGPQEHTLIRKE